MASERARIRLTRTGGFAGIRTEAELDTAELASDQAAAVLRALDATDLAALARTADAAPVPDRFAYELEVQRGGDTQRAAFGEGRVPEALRPLLDVLGERSRPAPR